MAATVGVERMCGKGLGLVAKADYQPGQLILLDQPLVVVSAEPWRQGDTMSSAQVGNNKSMAIIFLF